MLHLILIIYIILIGDFDYLLNSGQQFEFEEKKFSYLIY